MEGDSHDRKSPCVRRPFVWIAARRLRRFSWAGGTSTSRTRRVAAGGGLCGSAARRIFGGTQVGEGGRGVDSGATSPMEPLSKEKEVNSMPLAGQGNNHSSPSLDPTPGK